MDGLEAIGNVILGFVNLLVFISSFLVRGIVWAFAQIANLFGWKLGHNFVHKTMLGLALILSFYLGLGYLLMSQGLISDAVMGSVYSGIILYPVILFTGIVWVGYFCAPSETENPRTRVAKVARSDILTMYYSTALMLIGIVLVTIKFVGLRYDYQLEQRNAAKLERCLEKRQDTGDKLSSLADKIGLGDKLSKDVGDKLLESCK